MVETIQFGVTSLGLPAGKPAMATIFLTPSFSAKSTQAYMDFSYWRPVSEGQSGLQDVLRAEMRMPRFVSSAWKSASFLGSAKSSCVWQCFCAPQPPAVISTASMPRDFTLSSMSVYERSANTSVQIASCMIFTCFSFTQSLNGTQTPPLSADSTHFVIQRIPSIPALMSG